MELKVNGESRRLDANTTLLELLESCGVDEAATGVAVAVNDSVVPRQRWGATALRDGDTIEIIHAVQGG